MQNVHLGIWEKIRGMALVVVQVMLLMMEENNFLKVKLLPIQNPESICHHVWRTDPKSDQS